MKTTFPRGRCLIVSAIPFLLISQISFAGFCASATDPSTVYCEDFSGPNPLANYIITNGYLGSIPFTSIGVINQTLVWVNNPTGLASAIVDYMTPVLRRKLRKLAREPGVR
jgi:hypothetical protein